MAAFFSQNIQPKLLDAFEKDAYTASISLEYRYIIKYLYKNITM